MPLPCDKNFQASSEAVSKLQAVQYTLETTQREKEATIGELKASERHLRERVTSAETRAQEIDQKLVSMDADLVESSSNARSAEARMKVILLKIVLCPSLGPMDYIQKETDLLSRWI